MFVSVFVFFMCVVIMLSCVAAFCGGLFVVGLMLLSVCCVFVLVC